MLCIFDILNLRELKTVHRDDEPTFPQSWGRVGFEVQPLQFAILLKGIMAIMICPGYFSVGVLAIFTPAQSWAGVARPSVGSVPPLISTSKFGCIF